MLRGCGTLALRINTPNPKSIAGILLMSAIRVYSVSIILVLTFEKGQSRLQQTTNFATSLLIFEKNKVCYFMRIVCQQTILMK